MKIRGFWCAVGAIMVMLFTVFSGCSSSTGGTTGVPAATGTSSVSFKSSVQPIFNANCVVCHQGSRAPQGLSLEPDVAYQDLVNIASVESPLMRVAPGAPDKSYLVNKLRGTQQQAGGSGVQMPFGATPLSEQNISLIEQWIASGATDN